MKGREQKLSLKRANDFLEIVKTNLRIRAKQQRNAAYNQKKNKNKEQLREKAEGKEEGKR